MKQKQHSELGGVIGQPSIGAVALVGAALGNLARRACI